MARRIVRGGWYCPDCGWTTQRTPEGIVTCQRCGSLGLMGYENAAPKRVPCLVEGCNGRVWDDGGVNGPHVSQHRYERHPDPVTASNGSMAEAVATGLCRKESDNGAGAAPEQGEKR